MGKKKKVIFFTSPEVGGAERVTLTIAKMLPQSEYDITIAVAGRTKGEITGFVPEYMNVCLVRIRNIWDFTTLRFVRLLKKIRPDMVFSSLFYLNIRVVFAAKIVGGIKTIVRNNISFTRQGRLGSLLVQKAYQKADVIVCQTDEMKAEMESIKGVESKKIMVIRNPIDVETIIRLSDGCYSPFDKEHTHFVYVGRIAASKGTDILIKAFEKAHNAMPMSQLHIIGKLAIENSFQYALKSEITDRHLVDSVVWHGYQSNPYPFIKFADCFVLPSRVEGLPNVALEAMYLQTPVVATRCVPVIDRMIPKERGTVVDVEDVNGLANAMIIEVKRKIEKPYTELGNDSWTELFCINHL